MYRIR